MVALSQGVNFSPPVVMPAAYPGWTAPAMTAKEPLEILAPMVPVINLLVNVLMLSLPGLFGWILVKIVDDSEKAARGRPSNDVGIVNSPATSVSGAPKRF